MLTRDTTSLVWRRPLRDCAAPSIARAGGPGPRARHLLTAFASAGVESRESASTRTPNPAKRRRKVCTCWRTSVREIEGLAAEIEDRFGTPPDEVAFLLALARLAQTCRMLGIAKIDAGPQAMALTFRDGAAGSGYGQSDERLSWRGEHLILDQPTESPEQRLRAADRLLRQLARQRCPSP
jgi:hypothetical protein